MLWLIDPEYGLSEEAIPAYFDRDDIFGHANFLQHCEQPDTELVPAPLPR